jgi:Peptidase A4 family
VPLVALFVAHSRIAVGGTASLPGHFAGYQWNGSVRSVSANWQVPPLAQTVPTGIAATWIGIQRPASTLQRIPFIQVGLNENSSAGPLGGQYWAFWSDTARGFLPQPIFSVSPGDWITASLTQGGTGWTVSITDRNTGSSSSFIDRTEGSGSFATGDWLQEDPSHNDPHWQGSYQPTAAVTFDQLAVNGHAPQPDELEPSVMALPDTQLAPEALIGDAFTITERQPPA